MKLNIANGLALDPDYIGGGTFGFLAKKGAGKTYAARVLAEEFWRTHVQFVMIDPMGAGWGLRSSADGKGEGIPVAIFGGEHGDAPLERTGGALMADLAMEEGLSMVLDMSEMGSRGAERQFARDFLERLYRKNGSSGRLIHLLIDEADLFAPQKPSPGDQPLLGVTENIVRRGRNRGIGCTLLTQRPAVLNKDVLTQVDGLVAMRIVGLTDRQAIDKWVEGHGDVDAARNVKGTLAGLANGECWWWVPELNILKRVQVRPARTFDSSPTRTRATKREEPKTFADVNMDSIQERMAASIERAKADDPRELQRRIAELERELKRGAPIEAKQVEREVKVIVPDKTAVDKMVVLRKEMESHTNVFAKTIEECEGELMATVSVVREIQGEMRALLNETTVVLDRVGTSPQRVETAPRQPERGTVHAATRVPAGRGLSSSAPPRPAASNGSGPHDVKPAQRKLLNALASLEAIGVPQADKKQLALFAGVSPKSGAYFNSLGKLRSAGLIDYPTGGAAALTEAGRGEADASDAPSTTAELHERVRQIVKEAKWKIVEALIAVYPDSVPKEDLAVSIGVSPTSGAYFNSLGNLRSLGLIDYPSPGTAAATDVLFLTGA